jgi:hypothetical protein
MRLFPRNYVEMRALLVEPVGEAAASAAAAADASAGISAWQRNVAADGVSSSGGDSGGGVSARNISDVWQQHSGVAAASGQVRASTSGATRFDNDDDTVVASGIGLLACFVSIALAGKAANVDYHAHAAAGRLCRHPHD